VAEQWTSENRSVDMGGGKYARAFLALLRRSGLIAE